MVSKSRSVILPKPVNTTFLTEEIAGSKRESEFSITENRNIRSSQPIPPAPTSNTVVLASCACNSGPKIALAWALRAFAVDIAFQTMVVAGFPGLGMETGD